MGAVSRQDIAASVLTKSLKPAKTVAASDGETVTCGDHVAFKSERNGRYLSSSAGHLSTSSTSVTYNEIFTLHCVDKVWRGRMRASSSIALISADFRRFPLVSAGLRPHLRD